MIDYVAGDDESLEQPLLQTLTSHGQLAAYQHDGFWQCMDTSREMDLLNELWAHGNAPWAVVDGERMVTPDVLARPPRARHRPHRLQGRLADALARRASARACPATRCARHTQPSYFFELRPAPIGVGHTSSPTSATPRRCRRRCAAAAAAHRLPPRRAAARAPVAIAQPARDVRDQRDGHRATCSRRVRHTPSVERGRRSITSDKCYENHERGLRATARTTRSGGHDPYSASKAGAELVVDAYRRSFFPRRPRRRASPPCAPAT